MPDFGQHNQNIFTDAVAITANDTVDLVRPCRALWLPTAGAVAFQTFSKGMDTTGTTSTATITALAVPVGVFYMSCRRVCATGTVSGGILALY